MAAPVISAPLPGATRVARSRNESPPNPSPRTLRIRPDVSPGSPKSAIARAPAPRQRVLDSQSAPPSARAARWANAASRSPEGARPLHQIRRAAGEAPPHPACARTLQPSGGSSRRSGASIVSTGSGIHTAALSTRSRAIDSEDCASPGDTGASNTAMASPSQRRMLLCRSMIAEGFAPHNAAPLGSLEAAATDVGRPFFMAPRSCLRYTSEHVFRCPSPATEAGRRLSRHLGVFGSCEAT